MIRLVDVHLTLASAAGPVAILRGIDFRHQAGASVGIVGPSGSGKSSLMAVMTGLEAATSGEVEIAGRSLIGMDEDALGIERRDHMGLVMQSFHLIPTMTALENVAIPLELAGIADAFDRADQELRAVGLGHRAGHYPAQLSGGEQQRVALARALVPRPALLFADEPTGNLDSATGAEVIDLIFNLGRDHGASLILITHDPVLAARCDRVVEMRDGRLLDGAAAEAAQ